MYAIVESFARTKREWSRVNLADTKMLDVLTAYEEVHITIDDDGERVNWRPMTSTHYDIAIKTPFTLTEWIAHCNDNSIRLDVTSNPFTMDLLKSITSYSAFDIGFKADRSNFYVHPESDANLLGEDLRLTRAGTDYSKFVGNVMMSINGIIHPTASSENGFYAKGGHKALHGKPIEDLNLINFQELGGFTVQRLALLNMYKQEGGSVKLYENCCFNMKYDVTDKVFGIVIDGYLHLLDGVVQVVGTTSLKINWNKVPLLDRAIKMNGKTPSHSTVRGKELVNEADIRTNEWVEDLLVSPFTFLVVFNRKDITTSVTNLVSKNLPGIYEYPTDLQGAAFTGDGEILSFKKFRDRSSYAIAREEHTVFNLALKGAYPSAFDTRLGGITQHGTEGTFAGRDGFHYPPVKMIQFHVLPENF